MRDNEFSHPREEFSAPGQEFSPLRQEFFLSGKEQFPGGEEFHQTAKPPEQKKKKRINPLMLTASAVVTASVVINSVSTDFHFPKKVLHPEDRALITSIETALVNQDIETLLSMDYPEIIPPFLMNTVAPYMKECYDMQPATYHYRDWWYDTYETSKSGDYTSDVYRTVISFDGTAIGPWYYYMKSDPTFDIYHSVSTPDDPSNAIYLNTSFYREDPHDHDNELQEYQHQYFQKSYDPQGVPSSWDYSSYLCTAAQVPEESGGYSIHDLFHSGIHMAARTYRNMVMEVTEGSFVNVLTEDEDHSYYQHFLHNGTVTVYWDVNGSWQPVCVIEVIDGVTQLNDNISAEPYLYGDGTTGHTLRVFLPDGSDYPLVTENKYREEFLYHTFQVY